MEEVKITTEFIKLEALLKFTGTFSTGGEAKAAIKAGEVMVNGAACTQRGRKIHPGDTVSFQGKTFTVI